MAAGLGSKRRFYLILFSSLAALGACVFLMSAFGPYAQRAWQAYLVNFMFWTGICFGCVLLSAAMIMTNARWGRSLKRLAEAPGAFLPVAFLLFWVLYFGKERLFPWVLEPVHGKEAWLSAGFLFARDGFAFFLLAAAALFIIYHSVRNDLEFIASGTWSEDAETASPETLRQQSMFSPVFGILYPVVLSLLAFDLIMSLNPHWVSTLFGAYFFIGSFYSGIAMMIIISSLSIKTLGLGSFVQGKHLHDLGKLLLAFGIMTGDFFYSQFLVIWYGNMPEETRYVLSRVRESPWDAFAWTVLLLCFVIPFFTLLSRKIKTKPLAMIALCSLILVGMWLERFLLIVPSVWKSDEIPLGIIEILISAGFFGLVALCVVLFLERFPMIPISDPLFQEYIEAERRKAQA